MDKELQDAINEYERHLETGEPTFLSPQTLMDIEEYYENANRAYDAEEIMRYAERQYPDSEDVLIVKAYRFKARGQWSEATKIIDALPNQEHREVILFRLEGDIASGRSDEAISAFEAMQLPDDEEERNDWYLDMGELCLDYGYFDDAIRLLGRIPSTYGLYNRALELTGDAYYQLQEYDRSIDTFNKLTDLNPYDSVTWGQLAEIQQKAGRYEDSLTSCDYALAVDETNQRAMNLKLFATLTLGRFDEGLKLYHVFTRKMPDDYAIRMYVGEQYVSRGQYELALRPLEEALKLSPVDSPDRQRIISSLITAEAGTGNGERILPILLTQVITGREDFDVIMEGAEALLSRQFVGEAIRLLDYGLTNAAAVHPDYYPHALLRILRFLCTNNLYQEAMPLWKRMAATSDLDELYRHAYAYFALAMYIGQDKQLFEFNFLRAMKHCPMALLDLLGSKLHANDIDTLLTHAQEEMKKWKG